MADDLAPIVMPELIFGFVAPIGVDITTSVETFANYFKQHGYNPVLIKVTDAFKILKSLLEPKPPLTATPLHKRYETYIDYGNALRKHFDDNALLAKTAICRIVSRRGRLQRRPDELFSKTVYLVHQFKRKEEVDLFKQVYGRLFFQISIYSRRSARADFLARKFAHTSNSSDIDSYRSFAEDLLQRDALELQEKYGQDVTRIFHDADLIVNTDISNPSPADQIIRFCELLFGANSISPTKPEYGMLAARMAALRSLDLSRQVGAAIFTGSGEIIALGSNEVPKAGGGTYWCDDPFDDREFRRSADSNDQRKREIFGEVLDVLSPGADLNAAMANEAVRNLQLMDALEYGRIVHAEMSALMDAARLGRSVRGGTLFCTTFPCHMCAKHIVAAGLAKVVFLEPYPKSLAFDLHSDSLEIEGTDRGKYSRYPSVVFEHFSGITPRRYRDMFPRGKRKEGGMFARYGKSTKAPPQPTIDIRIPVYAHLESAVLQNLFKSIESVSKRQVPPLFQTF